ncbi:small glutamine-rich tetratricopeptide repeat-containing protein beta [Ixodes scapularis]
MSHVKRLVLSIVQFLRQQLQTADLSSDAKESVEVAVQCLETAYGVSIDDLSNDSLLVSRTLLDIFREVVVQEHVSGPVCIVSHDDRSTTVDVRITRSSVQTNWVQISG